MNRASGSASRCQMMTRMERATAHLALFAAEAPGQAAEPLAEEGVGAGGAVGGLGAVALAGRRRPGPCPACGCGARTGGRPGPARPRTRGGPAVGNRVMSRPVSAMIALARSGLTPGISASRSAAGSTAAPGPGLGGRDAVGADAPGGGDRVQGGLDLVLDRGDQPVQQGDVVQVDADQPGVVIAERHALQGLLDGGAAALDAAVRPGRPGPSGRARRRRWPPGCRGRSWSWPATCTADDSLTRAPSSSFSSRCHSRVRSRTSCSRVRVRSRSARISGGGTNDGRSRPISASRAIHCASSWSVFGRPASCRACGGVHQLHAQPGGLQQVVPDPPVIRRRLHDDQLDPVGEQPPGQRQDLPRRRGDLLHPRRPPPAVARPGAAGCTRPPSPSRCRSPPPARGGAGTPRPPLAARESSAPSRDPPGASYAWNR